MRSAPPHWLGALVLTALGSGCARPPAPLPTPEDLLVIAAVNRQGTLTTVARYLDGVWDRPPWAGAVEMERLSALPGADGSWSWPDGRATWDGPGRDLDTLGHPASVVAAGVPDSWHIYGAEQQDMQLETFAVRLANKSCYGIGWVVDTQEGGPFAADLFPYRGLFNAAGVALSRPPTAVLSAADVPAGGRIREELGFGDGQGPPSPSGRPTEIGFGWLGFFLVDDVTIGVLERTSGGSGTQYAVIEIDGDAGRILTEVRNEPCYDIFRTREDPVAVSEEEPGARAAAPFAQPGSPDSPPGTTDDLTASTLWVAVADTEGSLAPVARYEDGDWEVPPWAAVFDLTEIVAARSGDGVWSWPDPSTLRDDPDPEALDGGSDAPGVIATGVPASWLVFPQELEELSVATAALRIESTHCLNRWAVATDRNRLPGPGSSGIHPTLSGVALSHIPSAVLSESDIPDLDRIREELGFVESTEGKLIRNFDWLGIFRFEDGTLGDVTFGVLHERYYEGSGFSIIVIEGEGGRVVARASEGGC